MSHARAATMTVRKAAPKTCIIDVQGEVTGAAEDTLMIAYGAAVEQGAKSIILNFGEMEYMNSSGIGLLVTLLIRCNRQKQRLLCYGLSEHYRQIFDLTRLSEAIDIYGTESEALAALAASPHLR